MGVDPAKVAAPETFRASFDIWLQTPDAERTFFPYVWLVDDDSIGYSTVKDLRRGRDGNLHLHVWSPSMRGRGYGAPLLCLTVLDAYERFRLTTLRCEPKVDNPYPNRMLAKAGFVLESTRRGRSSELSDDVDLATYRLDRSFAERLLARHERTADGGVRA